MAARAAGRWFKCLQLRSAELTLLSPELCLRRQAWRSECSCRDGRLLSPRSGPEAARAR